MTTATIDLDILNDLFDNQQKLDDVFSSIFDDDPFLSSSTSVKGKSSGSTSSSWEDDKDFFSYDDDYSFDDDGIVCAQKNRNIAYIIMPVVLEIAVFYYSIMYFT